MVNIKHSFIRLLLPLAALCAAAAGCADVAGIESRLEDLSTRVDALEDALAQTNNNAIAIKKLYDSEIGIVGKTEKFLGDGTVCGYFLELTDGTSIEITFGDRIPVDAPLLGVDSDGNWIYSFDGETWAVIEGAANAFQEEGATPEIGVDAEGYWTVSKDGQTFERILDQSGKPVSAGGSGSSMSRIFSDVKYDESASEMVFSLKTGEVVRVPYFGDFFFIVKGLDEGEVITLGEVREYELAMSSVKDAVIEAPDGWRGVISDGIFTVTAPSSGTAGQYSFIFWLVSEKGFLKKVTATFTLNPVHITLDACREYKEFEAGSPENVLLDFSYAGYKHGETAPPDVWSLGYTVYDVTAYGAIPNDGISDRDALYAALQAAGIGDPDNKTYKADAKAIIYFPEGEYILHTSADNTATETVPIVIRGGNFILKGAGRDKTTLVMQDKSVTDTPDVLYSSEPMINITNWTGLKALTTVTSDAPKGSYSVDVASTTGLSAGKYVCLRLTNNDSELIAQELAPYSIESTMTNLRDVGVQVIDYHQIKSISGNTLTFYEPIMHEVEAKWGWEVQQYTYYSGVGVEDLKFKGFAKDNFHHHGSYEDDGAFKPLTMVRLTDSWMRRVDFEDVSEACSITNCANVSAYDINITGNRGHSAIRSQGSSRVFIGAVTDLTEGYAITDAGVPSTSLYLDNAGQYHACGVSKQSIGTVLWRNRWGDDSCFECHATQPRATLIDCCEGGWMRYRQGGDIAQQPHHLADLTIWNFHATTTNKLGEPSDVDGKFKWWTGTWWKFLPPVIVGFTSDYGQVFDETQVKRIDNPGTFVVPESLYEQQLKRRMGIVPAWLNSLK
ncbi:MAG: DUF4955 domain-containing protein [Candidatus Cryptobacteroides sp.]